MGGGFIWLIAKYKFRKISVKLGYSIPVNVFGPGLSLPHRGNIIINPQTHIGENCRIHVGVNIGAHHDKAPRIGNNVYIGPGANCVIAGTPAKVIKTDVTSWNGIKPINK